jgi:hypothetical protein
MEGEEEEEVDMRMITGCDAVTMLRLMTALTTLPCMSWFTRCAGQPRASHWRLGPGAGGGGGAAPAPRPRGRLGKGRATRHGTIRFWEGHGGGGGGTGWCSTGGVSIGVKMGRRRGGCVCGGGTEGEGC